MQSSAKVVVLAILAGASRAPAPSQPNLSGIVFVDRNANGARDAGEPGLAGVSVSDQNEVVATAADGSFRIPHSLGSGILFVSVPDSYRAVGPFWQRLRAIVDSVKPALVLITGDLVKDALRVGEPEATGYYDLFQSEREKFSAPVWTVRWWVPATGPG